MIVYKAKKGNGGLGDRLVGLVSCIFLSKLIEEELYIDWTNPNIDFCLSYNSIYNYNLQSIRLIDLEDSVRFIEKLPDLKSFFSNKVIESNLNFIDRFFINKNIDRSLFEENILLTYADLFKKHLIPKTNLLERINNNTKYFRGVTIGIQLRMGDTYMNVGEHQNLKKENIDNIFKKISIHQSFDTLFISSDNKEVVDQAYCYFNNKYIIYDDAEIRHIDRMQTNNDEMLKTLSDLITLSKTDFRYISLGSNFGRVSNLISYTPSNYIAISDNNLINKDLGELSKKEKLFI